MERILISKEFIKRLNPITIRNIKYFKLTELQEKHSFAFCYLIEEIKTIVYLIHTLTVFNDCILFAAYCDGILSKDEMNFKDIFDSNVIFKKISPPILYENLFLNELFDPGVLPCYSTKFWDSNKALHYLEMKVRFVTLLPNLEFLCITKNILWYRALINNNIVYLYHDKVRLYFVGFNLGYRNRVKDAIVEESLSKYINPLFLNRSNNEDYLCNELPLIIHLNNPNITRYNSLLCS